MKNKEGPPQAPEFREKAPSSPQLIMISDSNIEARAGGLETSALTILGYGKSLVEWTCLSPFNIKIEGTHTKQVNRKTPEGSSPQDTEIGVTQAIELCKFLKEKDPTLIILIHPRGKYMLSIIYYIEQMLPEYLPRIVARWGSELDANIIQFPGELDESFHVRKLQQKKNQEIQSEVANKIRINLAISNTVKKSLIRIGVIPEKIQIVTNQAGAEISSYIRRNDVEGVHRAQFLDPDEFGIFVASRVVRHKGLNWIKELHCALTRRYNVDGKTPFNKVKITLVGDPLDKQLLHELMNMPHDPAVPVTFQYDGKLTLEMMSRYYNAYDILFNPSPSEGSSRVAIEAAKAGMPTIGRSDCLGVNELLSSANTTGQVGILVNSADEAAQHIFQLMCDPKHLNAMRKNAEKWASEKYNPEYVEHEFWRAVID